MRLLGHTLSGIQMQCTGFGMSIITNDSLCEHRGWIRDLGGCRLGPAWLHLCVSLYVESIHLLQDKSYGVFTNQAQVRPQKCVLFIASFQLLLQLSILSHQLVSGLMKKYKRTHFTKSVPYILNVISISEAESSFIGFKSWCVYLCFKSCMQLMGQKQRNAYILVHVQRTWKQVLCISCYFSHSLASLL